MKDLGFINANNVEFALLDQPEALGMRFSDQEQQIIIAVASLSAAELSGSMLYYAQQQVARLPEDERKASLERYRNHPRLMPIISHGMDYDKESNELIVNLDGAVLRYILSPEAKAQLKELAAAL